MGPLWIEAFRYHKWANLHLLEVCANLSDEELQLTSTGTYGTIAATLIHMLAAERRYLWRLGGNEAQPKDPDGFSGIAVLKDQAARSGDQLIEAATRITPDDTTEITHEGEASRVHLGVVIIQALHHGNDHRTQICTILGSHGIPYGDMDVWAYGEATGAIVPPFSNS